MSGNPAVDVAVSAGRPPVAAKAHWGAFARPAAAALSHEPTHDHRLDP